MKIFAVFCLSLCLLAEAVPLESESETDVNGLAEEILDVFLNKKSTMEDGDEAADEETDDENERLDMRILEDILASDEAKLLTDLKTRMSTKEGFAAFLDGTLVPKVLAYMLDATKDLPYFVKDILVNSNVPDFACQLSQNSDPKWLTTLKRVYPAIEDLADDICKNDLMSCKEVYDNAGPSKPVSGEYYLTNSQYQKYKVYCEFYNGYIYTFVAPTSLKSLPISDLYNNDNEILLRYRLKNGNQRQSTIGQIKKYKGREISVQYDASVGYNPIRNSQMSPYMYAGLLPKSGIIHKKDVQGYSVNGQDNTFTNCDGNPNSYFALLYNAANTKPSSYGGANTFMKQWIEDSQKIDASHYLPENYFSFFEMHMGGCGGFMTLNHLPDMAGIVFGLRYDFPLSSCKDVYDNAGPNGAINGEYYLTNDQNQKYKVFCEFHTDHIYTFVAPNNLQSIPISDLYNNDKEILLRYRLKKGNQRQSTIGQIKKYKGREISVQYDASVGYNPIRNSQMSPYMYAGLLPKSGINHKKDVQGYSVNGQDKTFTNCDGNPNSYFALLYNAANTKPSSYGGANTFMKQWIEDSQKIDASHYLPENYFSFFEMHMGGCGGFMTLNHLPDMAGIVFGLRYDLP